MSGNGVARVEDTAAIVLAVDEGCNAAEARRRGIPSSSFRRARQIRDERPDLYDDLRAGRTTTATARNRMVRERTDVVDNETALNLPALCDDAIRELTEAKDIGTVLEIRDRTEALRVYARKRGAAVGAQNRCLEIVTLAESRIGKELVRLEKNKGGGDVRNTSNKKLGVKTRPTIPELGLTHVQSSAYQALARAPETAIHAAIEKATVEGRAATPAEVRRAAREAAPPKPPKPPKIGGTKRKVGGPRRKGRPVAPAPTPADTDPTGVRAMVSHASAWIVQGTRVRSAFRGDGEELVRRAGGLGVRFAPDEIDSLRDFLDGMRRAFDADGAAAGRVNADGGGRSAAPAS